VIELLVEVKWGGGRLPRQYTMLLDPEGVGSDAAAARALAIRPQRVARTEAEAAVATSAPGNVGGSGAQRAACPKPLR